MNVQRGALRLKFMRSRRIELKLTQAYMADCLGFRNASTYMKYEKGEYAFKAEQLPILAEALGCSIEELYESQREDES